MNTGSKDGNLTMTTVNKPSYLDFTWDAEMTVLAGKATKTVTFTLFVHADAPEEAFNFDVILSNTAGGK